MVGEDVCTPVTVRVGGRRVKADRASSRRAGLGACHAVLLFFLLGMNLRAGVGGIPPLLLPISRDLRLSGAGQGMLTSAAILSMAVCAPAGPRLARRFGHGRSISLLLLLLAAGEGMRIVAFTDAALFASIIAVGVAAGAGSTIVPALVIEWVPDRRGLVTGFLAAGMALGVGVAALSAAPLAHITGSWRASLAMWALFSLATLVLWDRGVGSRSPVSSGLAEPVDRRATVSLRSPALWPAVLYTSTPMVVGFAMMAWVSPFFIDLGMSTSASAARLFLFQSMQLASMTTLPTLADRLRDLRPLLGLPLVCIGGGIVMLLVDPLGSDPYAVAMLGIGVGGNTALGIALISLVSPSRAIASSVGGIVFTVAFACSALGPVALGELHDRTGSYAAGFAALVARTIAALVASSRLKPGVTVSAVHN